MSNSGSPVKSNKAGTSFSNVGSILVTLTQLTQLNRTSTLTHRVKDLSVPEFICLLDFITAEFQQFLRAIDTIDNEVLETMLDQVLEAMLDQVLEAITLKIGQILQAEHTTIFLVDREQGQLRSKIVQDNTQNSIEISTAINVGIAGHVATTGEYLNIPDASSHQLFNSELETQLGFQIRNILCMPILSSKDQVIAVAQLTNKAGNIPFDNNDEERFRDFAASISTLLETCLSFQKAARHQAGTNALLRATASESSKRLLNLSEEDRLEDQLIADANNVQQVSPVSIGISDEKQLKSTNDDAISFPSLSSLRSAHSELLKRYRESGSTPELLAEIEEFIYRGRATGALLDTDEDRWASQSLLDYWSAISYRAGREPPDATLAEFDPALAPELDDARCPYLGLEAFREEKSNLFYGRQRLLEKLVNHLKENRLLAVIGSSSSGKSSVVLGGLLPKLKAGALPGSENWHYYSPMVPGVNPLENLARLTQPRNVNATEWLQQQVESFHKDPNHLTKLSNEFGNRPSVLVVDQFEEVFTLCRNDSVRQAFIDNLISLIESPGVRHTVILTMRTDFESQVARVPVFKDLFEQAQVRVTALDASELREAIEKPAELVGLKFEEGLVEALLQDVLGEPAALPLLQFTLLKLWDSRERNRVTWETYKRLGGGRQALARSADEFYEQLIPEEQVTVKRILLRMVRPTEGLEVTSNRIQRKTLYQAGEARDHVDRVLDKLIQARLVRLTQGNTPDDAQVEIAHEALIYAWSHLVSWLKEERETMRQRLHPQSVELERASLRLRTRSIRKGIFSFSSLLVFLSIISLFIFALHKERLAEQREDQIKQQWVTEYLKNTELSDSYKALYRALDSEPVANITFSPDKKLIAATSKDETVRLLNFQGEELADFGRVDGVTSVVFSPDGKRIATASEDKTIHLWNLQGKELTRFRGSEDRLISVAFSPDGKLIATASEDKTIRLWDLQGKELIRFKGSEDRLISVVFSPDGKLIATASEDKTIRLWDLQGKEITRFRTFEGQLTSVVFSSDGKLIATTSKDGTMRLWDLQGNNIAEFSYSND